MLKLSGPGTCLALVIVASCGLLTPPDAAQAAQTPLPGITSLTSSHTYPIQQGTLVTWTAQASAGAGVEYTFWLFVRGAWTNAQPYGPGNTFTWTPDPADVGSAKVQVWIRRTGAPVQYDDWAETPWFGIVAPPFAEAVYPALRLPIQTGTPMTWQTNAYYGVWPLEIEFWRYKVGRGWDLAQPYSTTHVFNWTPGPGDEGVYWLQAWVRGSGSTAEYEAWASSDTFAITNGPPARLTDVQLDQPYLAPGSTATWTAVAGGAGPAEYQFWRWKAGSGWSLARDYGPDSTFAWTIGPNDAGTYMLQAWTRRAGSTLPFEDYRGFGTFRVAAQAAGAPVVTSVAPYWQPYVGYPMTWTAASPSAPGTIEYQFWRYDASSAMWSLAQDYSPSNTYIWTPSQAGRHIIQVWVRRPGYNGAYEDWKSTGVFDVVPLQ